MSRDFWSRRRAAVAAEAEGEAQEALAAHRAEAEARQAEKTDEELLAELDLPDPDTLAPGDDIRGFLSDAVPARLKTRALRQLWRLNPALANLDGLLEYGEDYTDAATVVENLQSAYQVGKGMLAHVEALAEQAEAEEAAAAGEDTVAGADLPETPAATDAAGPAAEAGQSAGSGAADGTPADGAETKVVLAGATGGTDNDPVAAAPHRRMQFTFQTEGAA